MNEFSIICRILGSLFYRQPQDPLLAPLLALIREGKLAENWPLEQTELLSHLQQSSADLPALSLDFATLLVSKNALVPPYRSSWIPGSDQSEIREFLAQQGMPLSDTPADHFGTLLLAASWLEDNSPEGEFEAQTVLFDQYLLPWCGTFLGKVEAQASTLFYRTLAAISRQALQAMWDELEESPQSE